MAVNLHASDPAFAGAKRVGEDVEMLLQAAREQLGGEWRIVSSRMKLQKTLFEAEFDGRRVIGKVSKSRRARSTFGSLQKLWHAGMRPPSRYTVTEPLAWVDERSLLLQERAPGFSMLDSMQRREDVVEHARDAAAWLRCLWTMDVEAPTVSFERDDVARRAAELSRTLEEPLIEDMAKRVCDVLAVSPSTRVPSHGDFHPMNVFVAPERVTAIDLDTFAMREREVDVAYFLAQLANFGLHVHGSLAGTRSTRRAFLEACGPVNEERMAAHMAWTLLGSLHYDACILKVRSEKLPVMIDAAGELLDRGSLD
jgi:hypothetical protein